MSGTEPIPTCNIPEKIPVHLQKIRQPEMFQMFVKKYSQHQLMIEIYYEMISSNIVPKMGFEIEYDENMDGFQQLYQVIIE